MKAVVIDEHGDSDVMHYRTINMPALKPGQVRIAMRACSLNIMTFSETRHARRETPADDPGCDCAGVIAEMAPDVRGWSCGDRVLADPLARSTEKRIRTRRC